MGLTGNIGTRSRCADRPVTASVAASKPCDILIEGGEEADLLKTPLSGVYKATARGSKAECRSFRRKSLFGLPLRRAVAICLPSHVARLIQGCRNGHPLYKRVKKGGKGDLSPPHVRSTPSFACALTSLADSTTPICQWISNRSTGLLSGGPHLLTRPRRRKRPQMRIGSSSSRDTGVTGISPARIS